MSKRDELKRDMAKATADLVAVALNLTEERATISDVIAAAHRVRACRYKLEQRADD